MARILVIDDSATYLASIGQLLQKHGHECAFEENADAGIEAAIRSRPDLILMDVIMPGTSGFQATRMITRHPQTAHIPVIIVTTKTQPSDRMWGLRQGAREYLAKPVDEQVLINAINTVLNG